MRFLFHIFENKGMIMDKRKAENIRVKRAITDSLFDLMHKKSIADISIKEIIEHAGVARVSFYRNYKSKTDILVTLIRDILEEYVRTADYDISDYNNKKNVVRLFRTFRKYRRYVLDIHYSDLGSAIQLELENMWHSTPAYQRMTQEERYRLSMHTGAVTNMAMQWLVYDMPETPEELADIFCSNIR